MLPTNPRSAYGTCASLNPSAPLLATPTLVLGSGMIPPSIVASYFWPPITIGVAPSVLFVSNLPSFTSTGSIITLPPQATPTSVPIGYGSMKIDPGTGWTNGQDQIPFQVKKNGCIYLDPWSGVGVSAPGICSV